MMLQGKFTSLLVRFYTDVTDYSLLSIPQWDSLFY